MMSDAAYRQQCIAAQRAAYERAGIRSWGPRDELMVDGWIHATRHVTGHAVVGRSDVGDNAVERYQLARARAERRDNVVPIR